MAPSCQCGGPFTNQFPYERIVNGFEAPPHSLPFQVGIILPFQNNQFFCGGTLISPNYVLTSIQCIARISDQFLDLVVVLGEHNLTVNDGERYVNVSDILIHPLALTKAPYILYYNYAILRLNSTVAISPANPFIGLACLPPVNFQTFNATRLTASGWGVTNYTSGFIVIRQCSFYDPVNVGLKVVF